MGDEAEAYMNRMINLPRVVTEKGYTQAEAQALKAVFLTQRNEGFNDGLAKGLEQGYRKGFDSARGQLLMKFVEWLDRDLNSPMEPAWLAHVAVEKFECDCCLYVDYDRGIEPNACQKWRDATQAQRAELFENVYGYSYAVYQMKKRQEEERRRAVMQKQFEEQRARAEAADRKALEDVDERLLP